MNAKEMAEMLNKECLVPLEKLQVRCIIHDVRSSFGRDEVLIIPKNGDGEQWVTFDRVTLA